MTRSEYLRSINQAAFETDEAGFLVEFLPVPLFDKQWLSETDFNSVFKPSDKVPYETALAALKMNCKVSRRSWTDIDWLAISCGDSREVHAENFWSVHAAEFAKSCGGKATVAPSIIKKTKAGVIVMGWTPTQEDQFADDWIIHITNRQ